MSEKTSLHPQSEKIKKALLWMCETLEQHPERKREHVLQQAELRFDLSPADCAFLDKNFAGSATDTCSPDTPE